MGFIDETLHCRRMVTLEFNRPISEVAKYLGIEEAQMTTQTSIESKSYCLNLHERYAPNWGVWECARELFANAKDAAPDTMKVHSPNANTLEISTPTAPHVAELFIIGCGSKSSVDSNIGQFGEGFKLTALAATRKPGSSLTVKLDKQTITFAIREHFGQQVLFADVAESEPFEGCKCSLVMEGAGFALNGKIIEGEQSAWFRKDPSANVQIFCKGIWITALDEKDALASYNLNDLTLNRDRSHADPFSIRSSIGRLLADGMTEQLAEMLVKFPKSWESNACLSAVWWSIPSQAEELLATAFRKIYGEMAVIFTDVSLASRIRDYGYEAINVGEGLKQALSGHIQTDEQIVASEEKLKPITVRETWTPMFAELRHLAHLVDIDAIEIAVFADRYGEMVGQAESSSRTIWLNERLFDENNRFERVRTFVHELGHIQAGGGDASRIFENSLDLIGGKLALLALDSATTEIQQIGQEVAVS
jgi:hypothetical protein